MIGRDNKKMYSICFSILQYKEKKYRRVKMPFGTFSFKLSGMPMVSQRICTTDKYNDDEESTYIGA